MSDSQEVEELADNADVPVRPAEDLAAKFGRFAPRRPRSAYQDPDLDDETRRRLTIQDIDRQEREIAER
jgi:hypothetical protein